MVGYVVVAAGVTVVVEMLTLGTVTVATTVGRVATVFVSRNVRVLVCTVAVVVVWKVAVSVMSTVAVAVRSTVAVSVVWTVDVAVMVSDTYRVAADTAVDVGMPRNELQKGVALFSFRTATTMSTALHSLSARPSMSW
jgi:hypothetical protein